MFEENILNIYTDYVKFTWVGFSLFFLRVTNCKANVKIKEKKKIFAVFCLRTDFCCFCVWEFID